MSIIHVFINAKPTWLIAKSNTYFHIIILQKGKVNVILETASNTVPKLFLTNVNCFSALNIFSCYMNLRSRTCSVPSQSLTVLVHQVALGHNISLSSHLGKWANGKSTHPQWYVTCYPLPL